MVIYEDENFKLMTLRTYVISTMRFDGHLSDGYPSTYGHLAQC